MIVMIDNYDSFTYNLVQYLEELGAEVKVFRNDEVTPFEIARLHPRGILISPGPSEPSRAGITLQVLHSLSPEIPTLGVCLGHQAIGMAFGGKVIRAPEPRHGKISPIRHTGVGIFSNLPSPFQATRYHSLVIERGSLPPELEIIAESEDDHQIMGVRHLSYPITGVQFHPESFMSEHGHTLVRNFLSLCGEIPSPQTLRG
jgi:anthranilate synthase component 2